MVTDKYRSYAFRMFKREFTSLSELHWYMTYAVQSARDRANALGAGPWKAADYVGRLCPASEFDASSLGMTPADFSIGASDMLSHLRTMLLIKACATMEDFMHSCCRFWAIWKGYRADAFNKLTDVGQAIVKPAMVSNISSSTLYIEKLFGLDFGPQRALLSQAYKLRCVAAHNGGVVTAGELPKLKSVVKCKAGDPLRIDWDLLQKYLKCIHNICETTELAIPPRERYVAEIYWILQDIFDANPSPTFTAEKARQILFSVYGFQGAPQKKAIAKKFARREA